MENLIQFIPQDLIILVAATYILGIFLKRIEVIRDNLIPILLMTFTIAFSLVIAGFNATSILQGILCWGVSVGINQTVKQQLKK
ncbi:phage holin family protein [Clostridium perfringens]|nr:phage holin family protein [Clostridium perfringens]